MMSIELLHQERSFEIFEPNIFTQSTCKNSAPSMKRGWIGVFFLRKSIIISLVLDMFSSSLFFLHQSLNFLSIHRLVSIVDTATYSGVILELNHMNRLVTRYTVVCKESEKERRKHAALWGTSVKNNRFGERESC